MPQKRDQRPARLRWPEWLLPAFFLPSWLMSLGFHLILFVGVAFFFQRAGMTEGIDDSGRVVDIFVKEAADSTETPNENDANEENTEQTPTEETFAEVAEEEALVEEYLDQPLPLDNVFGAAPTDMPMDLPQVEPMTPPTRPPAAAAGSLPPGRGVTRFMGIKDQGTRFVFLIDCSGSMSGHGAFQVAKKELKNSISLLEPTQQFQVIYYNDRPLPWQRRGRNGDIYYANDSNKRLAYNFIDQALATGGTDHVPALMMGLNLNPEVLYFLTDADQKDRINNRDLAHITKSNNGRTRIHCIEFGAGPDLGLENFLTDLARKNGGSYTYRNVEEFSR